MAGSVAAGIFLVSLSIALVSVWPLYEKLKRSQEADLQANLQTRLLTINQVLERKVDIAEQVTSRTRARELLEGFNQGTVSPAEISTFSTRVLTEAMEQTDSLVGLRRFDAQQRAIASLGVFTESAALPILQAPTTEPQISGPVRINGELHLVVQTPIAHNGRDRVGDDLAIFALSELQTLVEDYRGLRSTGEMILVHQDAGEVAAFFPLRDGTQALSEPLSRVLTETLSAIASTGTEPRSRLEFLPNGAVVALAAVPNTDWAIALRMNRRELYASVHHELILVGFTVLAVSLLATGGVVLLLSPVIQRVADAEELEKEVLAKTAALMQVRRTQAQLVQSEKMSSLGLLVAGVAHEINNPMNFIHGNLTHLDNAADALIQAVRLLRQECPTLPASVAAQLEELEIDYIEDDLPALLNSVRIGSNRIRQIVLSLRNFSRLDESELKSVDIHHGLDSTLLLLQHRLKARPEHPAIEIVKHYGEIPPVECYPGQLNQVFMNLLVNAIDALEEHATNREFQDLKMNPCTITITTEMSDLETVAIKIADNGPGIPDAVQQQLYDPFFTTKPTGKGTGMGLAISHQIVMETHSGQLRCHSTLCAGTEFIVELPLQQTLVSVR
jgi:signal transduction histidine kinase